MLDELVEVSYNLVKCHIFGLYMLGYSLKETLKTGIVNPALAIGVGVLKGVFVDEAAAEKIHVIERIQQLLVRLFLEVGSAQTHSVRAHQVFGIFSLAQGLGKVQQDCLVVLKFSEFVFAIWILATVLVEANVLVAAGLDLLEQADRTLLHLLPSFLNGLSFLVLVVFSFRLNLDLHGNIALIVDTLLLYLNGSIIGCVIILLLVKSA